MQEQIKKISHEFFELMAIVLDDLAVECQDEKKNIYFIQVKTPDSKILIGIHGQTLEATRHLLVRILEKKLVASLTIHLEVNDYLKSKDQKFFHYLDSRIAFAMRSGEEVILANLTSYDRKKAHGYISEKHIEYLRAFSVGEWAQRALHLSYASPGGLSVSEKANTSRSLSIEEEGVGI